MVPPSVYSINLRLWQLLFRVLVWHSIPYFLPAESVFGCCLCIKGRPISAEKDSFLSIVGARVEQKNGKLYTVQERDMLLLPGVIRLNACRPETYEMEEVVCFRPSNA